MELDASAIDDPGSRALRFGHSRACRYIFGAKDLEIRKFGPKRVIENPRIGAGQAILGPDRLACPREGSIR